jgi:endoglucanase
MSMRVGDKTYNVTVVDSSFEAFPTAAPTPAPTAAAPAPTPAQALVTGPLVPNVEAVKQHGRLRVQGNTIVGEHGMPVRLRGMSMFWSQWMGQYWNPDTIRWLKEDWHVSFIRAAMGVEQGGYLENPDAEKAKLQAVVDACIDAGIYVVIDWHAYHGEDHVEEAKAFFSEMAQRYGDKPHVLFETYNEPQQVDWSGVIKPYHEQVVPVIREHSDNVIILGTRTWSQEVDVASEDPVLGDNLAYTVHFYAASMGADLRGKVSTALANGIAIFATEWGTCEYTGDGRLDLDESQAWQDFMEENHISDSNWAISNKEESCSALRGGASGSGGWSEGDLTESGAWVRNSIQQYNSDEPLATVSAAGPAASSGQFEEILMKKHSMMRGAARLTGDSSSGWHTAAVAAPAICAVAALTLAAWAARHRRTMGLAHSVVVGRRPLYIRSGSEDTPRLK